MNSSAWPEDLLFLSLVLVNKAGFAYVGGFTDNRALKKSNLFSELFVFGSTKGTVRFDFVLSLF